MHHAKLPQRIRLAVEDLVRSDGVCLVVATTTLAQGVNLPIKTVLVRGLQHGRGIPVNPRSFWNICGRAGRAGKENEGQVLFCVDRTAPSAQRRRYEEAMREVIDTLEQATVVSAMGLLLQSIINWWRETHPQVDVAELCTYLTNNSYDWVSERSRNKVRRWLDILDGHLLALSEEFDIDPSTPDRLQEILEGSLLFIQLRNNPTAGINRNLATEILRSRISYIWSRHSKPSVRKRLYKLGMALSDCETVEDSSQELRELFMEASLWDDWSDEKRFDLLLRISKFVLELNEIRPKVVPEQWPGILSQWLKGISTTEMVKDSEVSSFSKDPSELSLYLEDVCGYRLPWGVNSILSYLAMLAKEREETLPLICCPINHRFTRCVRLKRSS